MSGILFFQELCQSVYDKNKSQGESTSDLPAEDGDEAEVAGEMQVDRLVVFIFGLVKKYVSSSPLFRS